MKKTLNKSNFGFETSSHPTNERLQTVSLSKDTVKHFAEKISNLDVQSVEYKPFLRFFVANSLNQATNNTLGNYLLNTIKKNKNNKSRFSYKILTRHQTKKRMGLIKGQLPACRIGFFIRNREVDLFQGIAALCNKSNFHANGYVGSKLR